MESSILVKAFALLEATAERSQPKSLGELATLVGQSKPTAHRILNTLSALGYVERSRTGYYRQTGQALQLVTGSDDRWLIDASLHTLRELYDSTRETVNLGVLKQGKIVYLHVLESPQPLRRVVEPNSIDPYYCTALGRAIVAYLPAERRESLLRTIPRKKCTAATVTNVDELGKILEAVAHDGYAVEKDQTDVGVTCIGAPVFNKNLPVAAISLSIPSARCSPSYEAELVGRIREAATEIAKRLAELAEDEQA